MIRMLMRLLLLMAVVLAPVAASAQVPRGRIDSVAPVVFLRGAPSTLAVNMTNTGASTEFLAEVTLPPGWTGGGTSSWQLVQGGQSRTFTFTITPQGSLSGTATVRLFGAENRNPSFPVLVDTFSTTLTSRAVPGEFDLFNPQRDQVIAVGPYPFEWEGASEATAYTLTIFPDGNNAPGAPPLARFENLAGTLQVVDFSGQPEGTFFWWEVEARNEVGTRKNLGGPSRFQLTPPPPLGEFSIVSPVRDAEVPTAPTISWTASANATSYTVEAYADVEGRPASTPSAIVPGITGTSYTFPETPVIPGRYHFQVFARRGTAERGAVNGPVRARLTNLRPFALLEPITTDPVSPRQPTFRWQATQTQGAFSFYRVNFYHRGAEAPFRTVQSPGATLNTFGSGVMFMPGTFYEWDVDVVAPQEQRRNDGGRATFLVSPVREFALFGPLDGTVDVPLVPEFRWNASPGALTYTVQIVPILEGVPNFPLQSNSGTLTQLAWTSTLPPFAPNAEFLWRVIASDSIGFAENFGGFQRVRVTPLRDFSLLSPPSGATDQDPQELILTWEAVPNASGYRVRFQLDDDTPLRSAVVAAPFFDASVDPGPRFNGNTLYRWTVEAIAGPIEKRAGQTFVFRTGQRTDAFGGDLLEALVLRQVLSGPERDALGVFQTPETNVVDASAYIRWLLGG